jgi:RNA polymerase sigma-70 factor, ECF subfamily
VSPIDRLRRRRKLEPRTKLDEIAEPAGEVRTDDPMLREKLRKLIHSLPEKARAVMILRYQEDLYPEEIAATMDIPVRTVKSLLQRSVALLRDKLDGARRVDKI